MKLVLSVTALCPCSGLTIYGQLVPIHKVNLQALENGILMGYCPAHQTRWFVGERGICHNIKQEATVVDRLYPKEKKPKEAKHGST